MFSKRVLHANGLNAVVGVLDDYLLMHADRESPGEVGCPSGGVLLCSAIGRKQLQRLVRRMQWAAKVVYGGGVFMRSLLDGLSTVLHHGHHVTLSSLMWADLRWWLEHAALHNGRVSLAPAATTFFVYTDACCVPHAQGLSPIPSIGVLCAGAFVSLSGASLEVLGLPLPTEGADINVWECFVVLATVQLF